MNIIQFSIGEDRGASFKKFSRYHKEPCRRAHITHTHLLPVAEIIQADGMVCGRFGMAPLGVLGMMQIPGVLISFHHVLRTFTLFPPDFGMIAEPIQHLSNMAPLVSSSRISSY